MTVIKACKLKFSVKNMDGLAHIHAELDLWDFKGYELRAKVIQSNNQLVYNVTEVHHRTCNIFSDNIQFV